NAALIIRTVTVELRDNGGSGFDQVGLYLDNVSDPNPCAHTVTPTSDGLVDAFDTPRSTQTMTKNYDPGIAIPAGLRMCAQMNGSGSESALVSVTGYNVASST